MALNRSAIRLMRFLVHFTLPRGPTSKPEPRTFTVELGHAHSPGRRQVRAGNREKSRSAVIQTQP